MFDGVMGMGAGANGWFWLLRLDRPPAPTALKRQDTLIYYAQELRSVWKLLRRVS